MSCVFCFMCHVYSCRLVAQVTLERVLPGKSKRHRGIHCNAKTRGEANHSSDGQTSHAATSKPTRPSCTSTAGSLVPLYAGFGFTFKKVSLCHVSLMYVCHVCLCHVCIPPVFYAKLSFQVVAHTVSFLARGSRTQNQNLLCTTRFL